MSLEKRKQRHLALLLPLSSLLLCWVLLEGVLFVGERFFGLNHFELYRKHTAEIAYFLDKNPADFAAFTHFDPLLGWRNYKTKDANVRETLNDQHWRQPARTPLRSNKKRIALVGDSFTFGWHVNDNETWGSYLQEKLGQNYEILNFGVRGYGLDQMTIVSNYIVPNYHPDVIVYAFIDWDIERSCFDFSFGAKKPYYKMEGGALSLKGVPVPRPEALWSHHQGQRLRNRLISLSRHSRVISLIGQARLQKQYRNCENKLAPAIIAHAQRTSQIPMVVVHLDGKLPQGFKKSLRKSVPHFISIPPSRKSVANRLGVPIERHADGHPKPGLNQIYAEIVQAYLKTHGLIEPPSAVIPLLQSAS